MVRGRCRGFERNDGVGKRKQDQQGEFWGVTADLARFTGHVYEKLNGLLAEAGFDPWVERLCAPYYANKRRPEIAPGVYFRMLLVGYFDGIGSLTDIRQFDKLFESTWALIQDHVTYVRTVTDEAC